MNFNITFTPAAPADGAVFGQLRLTITDSAGASHETAKNAARVDAEKIDNGDGSYTVPMTINGVAVGPYTAQVVSLSQQGNTMGDTISISGSITIEEGGAWFAQPTVAAAV